MGHSNRKRINISIQPKDWAELMRIKEQYGFKNLCQLLLAAGRILADRLREDKEKVYDLPEDEGEYIDEMFDELSYSERTPDGTVPVRHNNTTTYGKE